MDSSTPLPTSATNSGDMIPEESFSTSSSTNGDGDGYQESQSAPPPLARSVSSGSSSSRSEDSEEWEIFPPADKLTIFDFLDQLALPQRLEKINQTYMVQRDNLRKHSSKVKRRFEETRAMALQKTDIEKYRQKYTQGLDRIFDKWNDTRVVSTREKVSFVLGVSNIFVTGFLIGGYPMWSDWVHVWYSLQLLYFMPIRYYTYHQRGYHYFLADLCYFVNMMLVLSLWVFPNSRRLMISTYCLCYGNNAWAIAMWRNSMVFHSLDKVTSLFIHIMPPVVLHCLVHLVDPVYVEQRFPAISRIQGIDHIGLREMIIWATVPYAIWQVSYHLLITVKRRDKIAAGRPTSFTWLKKSYAKTWIGKAVIGLPVALQEPAFMFIQYCYAVLTMLPCPFWFYHRQFSAIFVSAVGLWSVYNGATYYIDVFGKRFQKELEQLKTEAAKWQNSPQMPTSPPLSAHGVSGTVAEGHRSIDSVGDLPRLDAEIMNRDAISTGQGGC